MGKLLIDEKIKHTLLVLLALNENIENEKIIKFWLLKEMKKYRKNHIIFIQQNNWLLKGTT